MNISQIMLAILRVFLLPLVIFIILAPFIIYILPLLPDIFVKAFTTIACIYLVLIFVAGVFFGRAYCYYICPITGLLLFIIRLIKNEEILRLKYPKWLNRFFIAVWFISFAYLVFQFVFPYNIGADIYHLPSVIILYGLLLIACILSLFFIRNDDNHPMCPLISFLITGTETAHKIGLPRLRLKAFPERCKTCNTCNKVCIASLNVSDLVKENFLGNTQNCFNCGRCSRVCKFGAISYSFGK